MHEDLKAPFDFAILKSTAELDQEKKDMLEGFRPFFRYDRLLTSERRKQLREEFDREWRAAFPDAPASRMEESLRGCLSVFDTVMSRGIIRMSPEIENKPPAFPILLIRENIAEEKTLGDLLTIGTADEYLRKRVTNTRTAERDLLINLLEDAMTQNVSFDTRRTEQEKQKLFGRISPTRGMVVKDEKIIARGETVTGEVFNKLVSLKAEHEKRTGSALTYFGIIGGRAIIVTLIVLVMLMYLMFFHDEVFANNKKVLLILLSISLMVVITALMVKNRSTYLYLVPFSLLPIVIRVFFDTRVALFVHLITCLVVGLMVSNSFEFALLQLSTGMVAIQSMVNLQKRSQFFLTSLLVFVSYALVYLGLTLMHEGSAEKFSSRTLALFGGNAILTLFSYPLIFLYEKMFGFTTDISLMEYSNTNSRLLRELASRAPGTFQHSMQVANLAEEAVFEIGGNALLVRTGALYHDIGKMDMPLYFIENQTTGYNPHDELTYEESARIIISHVVRGVEKARRFNIPDEIVDFIRTHHGTRKTDYFYSLQKAKYSGEVTDESLFTYNGPLPYSRETAVLMMADSVEAASRSLQRPNEQKIIGLVDHVIQRLLELGQFANANITIRDISRVKKVFIGKLLNIYHIRINYPE
jgi:putative nucleotidyltransferase with HDIG domain